MLTAHRVAGLATLDPDTLRLTFHVIGEPVPQGSARVIRGVLITKSAALTYWRSQVAHKAASVMADHQLGPLAGPVGLAVTFRFRALSSWPRWRLAAGDQPHYQRPDVDKLLRAVMDGLTEGGAYSDDGQVAEVHAVKRRCPDGWLGAEVVLWPLEQPLRPPRGKDQHAT